MLCSDIQKIVKNNFQLSNRQFERKTLKVMMMMTLLILSVLAIAVDSTVEERH